MSELFIYDWGETVRIIEIAPVQFLPGNLGSVCGMRMTEDGALYLIEFSDGQTIEILEKWLDAFPEE